VIVTSLSSYKALSDVKDGEFGIVPYASRQAAYAMIVSGKLLFLSGQSSFNLVRIDTTKPFFSIENAEWKLEYEHRDFNVDAANVGDVVRLTDGRSYLIAHRQDIYGSMSFVDIASGTLGTAAEITPALVHHRWSIVVREESRAGRERVLLRYPDSASDQEEKT
jgi:hypothetical protein